MKPKANEDRLIIADFCDDIRQEVGNKFSLMGCYGSQLLMEPIPGILPKLCVSIQVITPKDKPFKSMIVRALFNNELIAELNVEVDSALADFNNRASTPHPDQKRLCLRFQMAFSPLAVAEPGHIQIVAETEEGILKGPVLSIRSPTESDQVH